MEWSTNRTKEFVGVTPQGRMPGAGRAKLRLSRGLRRHLAYDVIPMDWSTNRTRNSLGFGITPQGRLTPKAPVRTEPHPTVTRCLAHYVIPYGLVNQSNKEFVGIWDHAARQVDAESPGSDGASPYRHALPGPLRHPLWIGRPIEQELILGSRRKAG